MKVTRTVKHNGKTYQAGEAIDLDATEDAAAIEQLTASGTIAAEAEIEAQPEASGEERQLGIVAAIQQLDETDAGLWSKGGVPHVKALEKALGFDITADERNHAWEACQEQTAAGK